MIIVTRGKVDGRPVGTEICGLTEAQEDRLVALGVAEYAEGNDVADDGVIATGDAIADDAGNGLARLTAEQLKEMCREYGLPATGKKADLIARIEDYERAWDEGAGDVQADEGGADDEAPELTAQVPE